MRVRRWPSWTFSILWSQCPKKAHLWFFVGPGVRVYIQRERGSEGARKGAKCVKCHIIQAYKGDGRLARGEGKRREGRESTPGGKQKQYTSWPVLYSAEGGGERRHGDTETRREGGGEGGSCESDAVFRAHGNYGTVRKRNSRSLLNKHLPTTLSI